MTHAALVAGEVWANEQGRWRAYHAQNIAARLAWVEETIGRASAAPEHLADHCASVLTLLDQARADRHLHAQIVNLLLALDPWPVRWGQGRAWEALLRFGVDATRAAGDRRRHAALLYALANCHLSSGQGRAAQDTARRALEAALDQGMVEKAVAALDLFVFVALRQGDTIAAQKLVTKVAGALDQADRLSLPAMVRLYFSYARIMRRMGRLEEALAWADRAVHRVEGARAETAGASDASLTADAYNVRGVMHWAAVHYPEAARDLERALAGYRAAGDRRAVTRVRGTLGLVWWSLGELNRAEALFRDVTRQAEADGDGLQAAINIGNLGLVALCRAKFGAAWEHFARQLALAEKNGDRHEAMRALGNRAIVRLHRGDCAAAMADLRIEQEFAEQSGRPEGLLCNYVTQARCLAGLGQAIEARTLAERTVTMARQTGSAALTIIALRCLAEHVTPDAAIAALAEALNLAQQTGRRLDEAACLLALAGLTAGPEQTITWRAGQRILTAIGAGAWLRGCTPDNPPRIVLIA